MPLLQSTEIVPRSQISPAKTTFGVFAMTAVDSSDGKYTNTKFFAIFTALNHALENLRTTATPLI